VGPTRHAELRAKPVRLSELEAASDLMLTAKVAAVPLICAGHMLAHSAAAKRPASMSRKRNVRAYRRRKNVFANAVRMRRSKHRCSCARTPPMGG